MPRLNRRQFLATPAVAPAFAAAPARPACIDFRYAPLSGQTAFCFPDDHHKSLAGERGELRYDGLSIGFSLLGMEPDRVVSQQLESPAVPIVHTRIERPQAWLDLTTFATDRADEGRVDNVILEIRPRQGGRLYAAAQLIVTSRGGVKCKDNTLLVDGVLLAVASTTLTGGRRARLAEGPAETNRPLRYFIRLPQQGQKIDAHADPDALLAEARAYWQRWRAFGGSLDWSLPSRYGEFLTACARNILQAREVKDGRLTFQVGPTVYRGLWVVDGHFILEAARYLGYDAEAQQGLETTWARQEADGGIFAGGGREHWKDTGIAMFTLVRQCELAADFTYFRKMQPELLRATAFLAALRERARTEDSTNGRYGLLPKGFGDGGIDGLRSEFTNTLWALAGLRAVTRTAERLQIADFEPVARLYGELRSALDAAMRKEMRRHPAGFLYLPMIVNDDPAWNDPNERRRPQPQCGQWALSHCIYPGLLFDPKDPVVAGHIALMQACTQEDIPAETGWIPHEGLWNYNAGFVAHVYLWAGLGDWARRTFHGFLNHATPLYCWREEQPLRGALTGDYIGDMPHNWASAECVLYMRHMLALEDGARLRLLAGIGETELASGGPYRLQNTPTRFGRLNLTVEPDGARGCLVRYERAAGDAPASVDLPAAIGKLRLTRVEGASMREERGHAEIEPAARTWTAIYAS